MVSATPFVVGEEWPGTLAVLRRRNRLRIVATLLVATLLYWLAVCLAAVTVGVLLALRVLIEGGEIPTSRDDLEWIGIGLGVVAALSAVIGSLLALVRLPLQRRRLEQLVLRETGAQVVTDADAHRRVRNLLEGLAIAAGLPQPRFAVVADPAPNSFAVGTRPQRAIVAVTEGAIDLLSRDELEAILAYEVSRIGSRDVALSSWTVALTGAAISALDHGAKQIVGWLPQQGSIRLQRWALHDAALDRDRAAVRFTRNPASLIRALEALHEDRSEIRSVSRATAPLWIEVPASVTSTGRVGLEERISALRRLALVGPDAADGDSSAAR